MIKAKWPLLLLAYALTTGLAFGADHRPADSRTVTVTGLGEVSAAPDKAVVSMGAQAIEPQLSAARQQVTRAVQSFLRLTRELGIEDKYVQTSQLSVRPEYEWKPDTHQQRLIGYFVERQLTVDLRDLEKLGVLMERAVSEGVNIVSGPQFGSSREDELRREALRRAAADAKTNAEVLAQSLGVTLGPLRRITAGSQGLEPPVIPYAMAKMETADASGAAETYQPGQIRITAQVTAAFDLIVK
jgi:uncharacterized protein